jgi:hypothetical protein
VRAGDFLFVTGQLGVNPKIAQLVLTLCDRDAVLKHRDEAQRFFRSDVETDLARRGLDVIVQKLKMRGQQLRGSGFFGPP